MDPGLAPGAGLGRDDMLGNCAARNDDEMARRGRPLT
jgi:hypothetical protein